MGMFGARKRSRIFAKTKGLCAYCGTELNPFVDWQVDHMTPVLFGGEGEENLVAACRSCNSRKQSKNVEEFREDARMKLLDHAAALAGPYQQYLTPEMAAELRNIVRRIVPLLRTASIVFELDRHAR